MFFVGIDWAAEVHVMCLCDDSGSVLAQREITHTGHGIREFATWLITKCGHDPASIRVGIEATTSALIDILVDHAIEVYLIHPTQSAMLRQLAAPSRRKSDWFDARVLADGLRRHPELWRLLAPCTPLQWQLRELTRMDLQLAREHVAMVVRLQYLLRRYFTQAIELGHDTGWVWDLLEIAPTPERALALSREEIADLLRRHRIRRMSVDDVCKALAVPSLPVAAGVADSIGHHVISEVRRLRALKAERRQLDKTIREALGRYDADHSGIVTLLQSIPGIGTHTAAILIADAGHMLTNYRALRGLAGTAPVTDQSGKHRQVMMRYACVGRLRLALFFIATRAIMRDRWARNLYDAQRKRGAGHARALRGVGDRLLYRLSGVVKSGKPYVIQPLHEAVSASNEVSDEETSC